MDALDFTNILELYAKHDAKVAEVSRQMAEVYAKIDAAIADANQAVSEANVVLAKFTK